jgi:hypothetical protein
LGCSRWAGAVGFKPGLKVSPRQFTCGQATNHQNHLFIGGLEAEAVKTQKHNGNQKAAALVGIGKGMGSDECLCIGCRQLGNGAAFLVVQALSGVSQGRLERRCTANALQSPMLEDLLVMNGAHG